ncbi:hypothetical protein [Micromonospora sp. NPDC005087]|uniref:hypothetical protein n=1 Tax=Micromonospora sp. NPDC005087 TaxID=3364225 RepID=UPI0036C90793
MRPMRGLGTDRTAQVVIAGHAFLQEPAPRSLRTRSRRPPDIAGRCGVHQTRLTEERQARLPGGWGARHAAPGGGRRRAGGNRAHRGRVGGRARPPWRRFWARAEIITRGIPGGVCVTVGCGGR